MIDKEKSLAYLYPEVAKEWHPTKNGNLSPNEVAPFSNKKAWWLGKCGHEWQSVISSRSKGAGCPYCSGYKALSGFNDLETLRPDLAKEWHPTRNNELTPSMFRPGSDRIVWWLGDCGHEWQQRIANRTNGAGCPYCESERISKKLKEYHMKESGSLAESFPEIAKEWHPTKNGELTPEIIVGGYNKNVWWLGKCGHEWQATPSSRTRGTGCPFCSNQKALPGFNDLETIFPNIAKEWHPTKNGDLLPNNVVAKSNKKVWWLGKCGHEWQATISKRTILNRGCPYCAKKLQTSFPEQAVFYYVNQIFPDSINSYKECFEGEMELDIFIPSLSVGVEYDGIQWHKSKESRIRETTKYEICKQNGIKLIRIIEGFEDYPQNENYDICIKASRHPTFNLLDNEINELLNILNVKTSVNTRRDEANIRALYTTGSATKPFGELFPDLLKEWDYEKNGTLNPNYFSVSSGASVWWKCPVCGHSWQQRIATRTQGIGCKECAKARRSKVRIQNRINKIGSLASAYPKLAKEWHPTKNGELTPNEVLAGSGKKVWWKCKEGHEWQATILSRAKGSGCPKCSPTAKKTNERFIIELFEKNNTIIALDEYKGAQKKIKFKCKVCGYIWEARPSDILSHGTGCPICARKRRKSEK